jgi:phosphopantothenoylcysteine decarboxylase/phosphopantothenate--cysteine ligase
MNVNMWQHPATQENLAALRKRGVRIVEPGEGYLACGMTGPGRLAAQDEILKAVREIVEAQQDLAGETVLVTAGPTYQQPFFGEDGLFGGGGGGAAWSESGFD